MYGTIKAAIWGAMPGTGEAPTIFLGLIVLILALLILRRGLADLAGFAAVLAVGLVIEALDVVLLHQSLARAGHDLLFFALAPFGLWLAARAQLLRA